MKLSYQSIFIHYFFFYESEIQEYFSSCSLMKDTMYMYNVVSSGCVVSKTCVSSVVSTSILVPVVKDANSFHFGFCEIIVQYSKHRTLVSLWWVSKYTFHLKEQILSKYMSAESLNIPITNLSSVPV